MIGFSMKKLLIVGMVAGGFLATPSESHAIFHWFSRCCAPRTTYLPPAPAVNCCPAPVCPPQVCNYVPVTAYRTQVCNVPVTAYRPSTSCDPCTGCPTTTYRPVTTYMRQVRRVPYTTYRLSCPTGTCGSTVNYPAPAFGAPSSSCSSCAPSTTYTTPSYTTPPPATSYPGPTSPSPITTPQSAPQTFDSGPASQPPALSPPAASSTPATPQTYASPPASGATLSRPIQDLNTSNTQAPAYPNPAPRLIDPDSRTTSLPVRTVTASYTTVYSPSAAMAPAVPVRLPAAYQTVSPEGWRSSRR